jgi:hypothetical protein
MTTIKAGATNNKLKLNLNKAIHASNGKTMAGRNINNITFAKPKYPIKGILPSL